MVVRILTDNQYRLADEHLTEIHQLDDQLVHAMDTGDEHQFHHALEALVGLVRGQGTLVPMAEVVPSDVIIPAPDMSLGEAHQLLQSIEARATGASAPEQQNQG